MQHLKTAFIAMLAFAAGLFVSCNQPGQQTTETPTADSAAVQTPPPAEQKTIVMVVSHHVKDYAAWRPFFDKDEANRQAAGMNVLGVFQDAADPNYVSVSLTVSNLEAAKTFASSDVLKQVMAEAGVIDQPEVKFYEFISLDETAATSSDNRLFIVAKVADFAAWKQVFDEREPVRKEKGVSTVVVARNLDDVSEVAVALTAADMGVLKNLMADQDVKNAMQRAGVMGEPIIQYAKKTPGAAI